MRMLMICCILNALSLFAVGQASITIGRGQFKKATQLHDLKVESELYGSVLVQRYEFSFFNDGRSMAEGEMSCYLPEGSRVVEYAMSVHGKKRDGVVVSAKIAEDAYEDIVRQRTDPGLLEIDEENNIFRMRVFPVEANKEKRVWITIVRLLDKDSVDLGMEKLGVAKKVSASIKIYSDKRPDLPSAEGWELKNKDGMWSASMVGENRALPACALSVNLKQRTFRYLDPATGTSYYATAKPMNTVKQKQYDGVTELWWDGTTEASFEVLQSLTEWMKWKQSGEVELTVFRDDLTKFGKFTIKDGKCDALIQKVQTFKAHGMARPKLLDWVGHYPGVVLVTDGVFAEGFNGIPEMVDFPLFPILTVDDEDHYLRGLALYSAESLLPDGIHDKGASEYQSHHLQTGFALDEIELPAIEHKVAYWLWAMNTAKLLKGRGYTSDVISEFHTDHRVADGDFSWIVLESIQQHVRYDIPPAESEVELLALWNEEKKRKEVGVAEKLAELEKVWARRCESHFSETPSYKQSAQQYLMNNAEMILGIPKEVIRLEPDEVAFYKASKTLVDKMKSESEIYDALKKFGERHTEIIKRIKLMTVTVTGQVGRSGPQFLPVGTPIYDVVMRAAPNTFAAMNRVELVRNGKIYKYNMKLKDHQKLKIYPNDQINIPQQMMFGNGGGKPGEKIPFKKYREQGDPKQPTVQSKRAKLVWDETKEYLQKLNVKALSDEDEWVAEYLSLRGVYGWRADFYEDLICLLEEEQRGDLAVFVALDFAELEPGNAEVLRRAARSLHRLGELDLALGIYYRLQVLSPESDVSYYDLGRVYESKNMYDEAANCFWKACLLIPSKNAEGRGIVYLEDLNASLQKGGLDHKTLGMPASLIRHVEMDTRVVLRWDAEQCNADLLVEQPMLGIGSGFIYPVESVNKWKWSRNVSSGMGPESSSVRNIDPGDYIIKAKFKGDWVHESKSTTTMTVEVIRHFGSKDEKRETVTRRVPEGKTLQMMTLSQDPRATLEE